MKLLLKRLSIIAILLCSMFSLTGCALISVNPERDNAVVIATIDGKDILKSEYNNYLALVQMNYEAGDATWPTGKSLKTLKENLYTSIIQQKVFALKAQQDGETIDEDEIVNNAKEQVTTLQEELGVDLYRKILSDNYSTPDQFEAWIEENYKESEYAQKTTDKFMDDWKNDPTKILDQTVGMINDTDVTRGEYEYRLVGETLNYYLSNQSALPTDKESMEATNLTIFEGIEDTLANIKYAEDNDIDITDEEITTAQESLGSMMNYFFQDDEQKANFLESYYLTIDEYNNYQKEQAKGNAAQTAIQNYLEENAEVSDSEAEKYYNDNIKDYDTTEVSAMHILAEDKEAADQIYDEAKNITDKEDFEALIEKYQDVDGVKEATDLGSFDYKTMVEEFSNAAFGADLNTVVRPVETQFGYHVIYVYDREDGEVEPFDDVKDDIITTLKEEKGQEEFDKLEEDITSGAKYDIPDEIQTPLEEYADQLESEYDVVKYENRIRA